MSCTDAFGWRERYEATSGPSGSVTDGAWRRQGSTRSTVAIPYRLVAEEALHVVPVERLATVEVGQLDDEAESGHLGAEPLHQPYRSARGTAGREHIVDDQDALAGQHAVPVYLELVGAIFQR